MSVCICLHPEHKKVEEWLRMSNGGMAVFLSVIVLSGSRLAIERKEKELIQWFSEQDDTIKGRGCNGFDLCDIPWGKENLSKEREFLLKVVDGAKKKLGWEVLDYNPKEELIFGYLEAFDRLLVDFSEKYIIDNGYSAWLKDNKVLEFWIPEEYPNCDERTKEFAEEIMKSYEETVIKFKKYLNEETYNAWAMNQKFPNLVLPQGIHYCGEHGTIISWNGCIVCNDK